MEVGIDELSRKIREAEKHVQTGAAADVTRHPHKLRFFTASHLALQHTAFQSTFSSQATR